jgi:hypothetical protein
MAGSSMMWFVCGLFVVGIRWIKGGCEVDQCRYYRAITGKLHRSHYTGMSVQGQYRVSTGLV